MYRILIILILFNLVLSGKAVSQGSASSQSGNGIVAIDSAGAQFNGDTIKPTFPSPDQIKKITSTREILGKSGINVYMGYAASSRNNSDLNQSFSSMESGFGINLPKQFPGSASSFTIGLKYRIDKHSGILWEYVYGGSPSDNNYRLSLVSLCATYTFLPEKFVSITLGAGGAVQRLKALRKYNHSLGNGSYLDKLHLNSGKQWGMPLIVLIELKPSPSNTRYSLFVSLRHILGPEVTVEQRVGSNQVSTLTADMNSNQITTGLAVGF
jgi:hypothetical protein